MARRSTQAAVREAATTLAEEGQTFEEPYLGPVKGWLSTGCTLLDLALANTLPGGFPSGRISHVYGAESTAKSLLALEPLSSAQRQGGIAFYEDAEATFDAERTKLLHGMDLSGDKWHYNIPRNLDELWDERIKFAIDQLSEYPIGGMAVDSLSAIAAASELGKKDGSPVTMSDVGYGTQRAKQLSTAFRRWHFALSQANLGLVFVNQARDDIGGFGSSEKPSSGRAILFYESVRVRLQHAGWITVPSTKITIGVQIKFTIEKNKVAPPYRKGQFALYFDYGIDDVESNLVWLKDLSGREDYVIGDYTTKRKDLAVKHVEDNNLESTIRDTVWAVWREVYKPADRKPRVRFDGSGEANDPENIGIPTEVGEDQAGGSGMETREG